MALISTGRCSPEPCARMQQHVLDDRVGALAVLHDLVEIALQHIGDLVDLGAQLAVEVRASKRLPQLVDQLDGERREIIDEIERVLDLVRNAGRQLAERGELFRLDQSVLRGPQILQRLRQFAGAGLHTFEKSHILNCDDGLVGEGRQQFDLFISVWLLAAALERHDANRLAFAHKRHAQNRIRPNPLRRFDHLEFWIG